MDEGLLLDRGILRFLISRALRFSGVVVRRTVSVLAALLVANSISCRALRPQLVGTLSEVTRLTSLHFPTGSRLVSGRRYDGLTRYVYCKVEMPASVFGQFLRQSKLAGINTDLSPRDFVKVANLEGADRDRVLRCRQYYSGKSEDASGTVYLFSDKADTTEAFLFIQWISP